MFLKYIVKKMKSYNIAENKYPQLSGSLLSGNKVIRSTSSLYNAVGNNKGRYSGKLSNDNMKKNNYILFWSKHSINCNNLFKNINFDIVSNYINLETISVDNKYIRNILKNNNTYKIYCVPTLLMINNNQNISKFENIRVFKWLVSNIPMCYRKNNVQYNRIQNLQQNQQELLKQYQEKVTKQNIEQEKIKQRLLEKQLESKIRKEIQQEMLLKNKNLPVYNIEKNINVENSKSESKEHNFDDNSIYDRHYTPRKKQLESLDNMNDNNVSGSELSSKQGIDNAGVNSAIRNNKTQLTQLDKLNNENINDDFKDKNKLKSEQYMSGRNTVASNHRDLRDKPVELIGGPDLISGSGKRLSTIEQAREIEKSRSKIKTLTANTNLYSRQ